MATEKKIEKLQLSIAMTGPPMRYLLDLAKNHDLNRNQVVRRAITQWYRLEEALADPGDQLCVRKADGTIKPLRFGL